MNAAALVLARMRSSRLPGKVLMQICGKSVLQHVIERVEQIACKPRVIVCTTEDPSDDPIAELAGRLGIACYRGSTDDVFARCMGAVAAYPCDVFFRLGADCPLFDIGAANEMAVLMEKSLKTSKPYDFLCNSIERTFPLGFDIELWRATLLPRLNRIHGDMDEKERETNRVNMVPYVMQHLGEFVTYCYKAERDVSAYRITLDTPEDFALLERVFADLYPHNYQSSAAVIQYLDAHPEIVAMNAAIMPRTGYWRDSERKKVELQRQKAFVGEYD